MGIEEAILSASFQVVFEKLASPILRELGFQWGVDKELRKLGRTLSKIQAVLNDAEARQISDTAVKMWLDDLKDVAFDADDILDEFETEALRLRLEDEANVNANQVWSIVPSLTPNMASFKLMVTSKINDIMYKLDEIAKERFDLGLQDGLGGRKIQIKERRQTSSLVNELCTHGRTKEKEKIVELLLADGESQKNVSVISIVGIGGLGKTTLAQLAYNDERVNRHFDIKSWVCISIDFNVRSSTRAILESATRQAYNLNNLEPLQVSLKETLNQKRFLIVLDDVWTEDRSEWLELQAPFFVGAKGSKIIITTRNMKVSFITKAIYTYRLGPLSNEDSQSLFIESTFPNGNSYEHPTLVAIGKEIVKKCRGLPCAIKAMGALLESVVDEKTWRDVQKRDLWDFQDDKNEFLAAPNSSYHHLPAYLKQCFTYCSIFPKGYEFQRERLILMWIAEGFVHPRGMKQLEDIGHEYFEDLYNQSFFQHSGHDSSLYVMHELLHDLAHSMARKICFRWESGEQQCISEGARYSSFFLCSTKPAQFESLFRAKKLRTFLLKRDYLFQSLPNDLVLQNMFQKLQCLRVLSFNQVSITQLPDSICNLKHLRYLDLSRTWITRLPESMNKLYNLQTLILTDCPNLIDLPKDMGNLINLRHLFLSTSCPLEQMPSRMGRLTCLQDLSYFVVSKQSRIGELRSMLQLQGSLCITNLQNITNMMDAKDANLNSKDRLRELELEWNDEVNATSDERLEENVLEYLRPNEGLKRLIIRSYGGKRFPTWLRESFLPKLVFLSLKNCKKCEFLPPLGQLPLLKHLSIMKMHQLKHVDAEFIGKGNFKGFPALETLILEDIPQWVEWLTTQEGAFSQLQNLHIRYCPRLRGISQQFFTLVTLEIQSCEELQVFLPGEEFPSLKNLSIKNCPKLQELPHIIAKLVKLELQDCGGLTMLPRLPSLCYLKSQGLAALQSLSCRLLGDNKMVRGEFPCLMDVTVWNCPKLSELPHFLPSLVKMDVRKCKNITVIPMPFLAHDLESSKDAGYPLLNELVLKDCPELRGSKHSLPSLKKLEIMRCQALDTLPSLPSLSSFEMEECEGMLLQHLHGCMSLSSLCLSKVSNLMCLPASSLKNITALRVLKISNCGELVSLWKDTGSDNFCSLHRLEIWCCPKLISLPEELPTILQHLKLMYCSNLESLPQGMHSIPLVDFEICNVDKLTSFPEVGLPNTLKRLVIKECKNLRHLPNGFHNLTSLELLEVRRCPLLASFPSEGFPVTLKWVSIYSCDNLGSLPDELHNLTSLKELRISNVPKLASLPEGTLPTVLSYLDIDACPLLTARCKKEGEDWFKIAHVPIKRIDGIEIF